MLDVKFNGCQFKIGKLEKWWVAFDDPKYFPEGRKFLGSDWFWRIVPAEASEIEQLKSLINALAPVVQKLESEHEDLKNALQAFCEFHEKQASWDKTGSVYYNAKKILNQINSKDGI